MRLLGGFFVEMKGLRVELTREALDLVRGEGVAAEFAPVANLDVVEIDHCDGPLCGARRPINSVLT